jgi:hypothetical protein
MSDSMLGADQETADDAARRVDGTLASASGPPPTAGADDHTPAPGELKFKEKRSWRTWQLVVAVIVAAVVGMWINGSTGGGSTTASGSTSGTLPPSNIGTGSSSASTTTTAAGGSSSVSTTTVAGGSSSASTTTTVAGGSTSASTSTPVVVGPNTVLIPATQLTGDWTSPNFTIAGGTWNIGWAFQCTPVPATTPTFAVYVVNAGGTVTGTSTPAVTSSAAQGQSVTPQTSTGSQQVVVQAPTGCRWAIKVTGFSG